MEPHYLVLQMDLFLIFGLPLELSLKIIVLLLELQPYVLALLVTFFTSVSLYASLSAKHSSCDSMKNPGTQASPFGFITYEDPVAESKIISQLIILLSRKFYNCKSVMKYIFLPDTATVREEASTMAEKKR